METVKGFKGFDKDFKCRGFQYKPGKSYETDKAKLCKSGFHFCEHPLDVFCYYAPTERFAEVEGSGAIDRKGGNDTKVACTKINIGAEIDISAMCKAAIKFVFDRVDWKSTKDKATGDLGAASATGDRGAASATGYHSIACGLGYASSAMGKKGCWIVLAERRDDYSIISVKAFEVDEKKVKENQFYTLKRGKLVKA